MFSRANMVECCSEVGLVLNIDLFKGLSTGKMPVAVVKCSFRDLYWVVPLTINNQIFQFSDWQSYLDKVNLRFTFILL